MPWKEKLITINNSFFTGVFLDLFDFEDNLLHYIELISKNITNIVAGTILKLFFIIVWPLIRRKLQIFHMDLTYGLKLKKSLTVSKM